jgi:SAM-dependent MidA family methyltransferase
MNALEQLIANEIEAAGGFLPFDRYMHLALYTPGLGYYAGGVPMGAQADFVTAPELTPLFGQTIARQIAQIFDAGVTAQILEFGAGTGKLARDVLNALAELGYPQACYQILDVSGSLSATQRATLATFGNRVQWLDAMPESFEGIMLGNEVLDAMPVTVFELNDGALLERGVSMHEDRLVRASRAMPENMLTAISMRLSEHKWLESRMDTAVYVSEIGFQAEAFIRTACASLRKGALLLIDYGFPRAEFYHPQRSGGTLMCFAQHRTHSDPLHAPGLEDITAHIDFSAMRDAAIEAGAQAAGYTSQARFLMNCGLLDRAAQLPQGDRIAYAQAIAPLHKLLSEAEMGELFKAIAFTKGIDMPLFGFANGDRSHRL